MKPGIIASAALCIMFLALPSWAASPAAAVSRANAGTTQNEPVVYEALVAPPNVPSPIHRNYAARVVVQLETREIVEPIGNGKSYDFWTFNGSVPGPLIRVRVGDTVELHLRNAPSSHMMHSIDLHAVMGPGGGAAVSQTLPGHESVFAFKAMRAGLFMYHCATAPVPMHIANGMYGMILVEPRSGLPRVDHEYYVVQGDFYTTRSFHYTGYSTGAHSRELVTFDLQKLIKEQPTYVLFNGRMGSLVGDRALRSRVGDTVRLFVGDGGPNLASSFHIIGQIFDSVHVEGGTLVNHAVQTTLIPPGGAAMIELRTLVPGMYLLVDHAITRAFMQGALGQLVVSGPAQPALYRKIWSGPIPDSSHHQAAGHRTP